jgi:hypothetical protein
MAVNFAKLLELLRRSLSPLWREVNRGSARSMLLPYAAPSIETIVEKGATPKVNDRWLGEREFI